MKFLLLLLLLFFHFTAAFFFTSCLLAVFPGPHIWICLLLFDNDTRFPLRIFVMTVQFCQSLFIQCPLLIITIYCQIVFHKDCTNQYLPVNDTAVSPHILLSSFFFFFNFMDAPTEYGSSWARDWIQAAAATIPKPLIHCVRLRIKPVPLKQPEPLRSDS